MTRRRAIGSRTGEPSNESHKDKEGWSEILLGAGSRPLFKGKFECFVRGGDTFGGSGASPTRSQGGGSRLNRSVSAAVEPTGEAYVPGVLRIHRPGFNYPLHFDTHHANAWDALRSWLCQEDVLKKSKLYT